MHARFPALRFRPAVAADADRLSAIALASKAHWGYAPEQLAAWREDLAITPQLIATARVGVAELAGEAVGTWVLQPGAGTWTLAHLWLLPQHIGQGLGRAMLDHAMTDAAAQGARRFAIDADPHAEAFYLACGAHRVGAEPAPLPGAPDRVRPQLLLPLPAPETMR